MSETDKPLVPVEGVLQYPAMLPRNRSKKQRPPRKKSHAAKARVHTSPPRKPARAVPRAKTPGRTPSPDIKLSHAVALAQKGRIKQAFKAAEDILAAHPKHWHTLNFLSSLLLRADQTEGALIFAERAIAHAPDDPEIHQRLTMNLASCANRAGRPEVAISACREFLDRYEPKADILATLSAVQIRVGRLADGLKSTDAGLALFPGNSTFHHNRSTALLNLGRAEEAVEAFGRTLRPLAGDPGDFSSGMVSQYAAMAEGYDDNPLHQLYGRLMAQMIVKAVGSTLNKRLLDAGCGTGSLGANLKTAYLAGIDLSPEMLAKARARHVYQELIEGNLVPAMAQRTDSFDIIASTVVLYHMSDLGPFFREASRLLVPRGHLFFSTDPAPDSMDIGVGAPGEYAHSRRYLRTLATEAGFAEVAIRIMEHRGNPGFWCVFRREAGS